jgi:hypothetical protein
MFLLYFVFYLSMGLEWNEVHCNCGQFLTHCTSPEGWMARIMVQLME